MVPSANPGFAAGHPVVDDNDRVVLHGNVHPHARAEFDVGATSATLPMDRMILALQLRPEKQAALDQLLAEQQDPHSPSYRHWLTPEEFGAQFGPSVEELAVVTDWLAAHGFVVEEVGQGRTWINFTGTVANVEGAFHTQIRNYVVNGKRRHANASDPAIPRGLAQLVSGVVSLHNFPRKPMRTNAESVAPAGNQPQYTSGNSHYISPGDFAIIYNLTPLYSGGIDGTGETIAIVGRTHPSATNWSTFRTSMALPSNPPQVVVNGPDPGDQGSDEDGEADLDVEWSGAVAKRATIKFVVSKSTAATDGVDLSAQYIVNNNLAPVMSTSFGSCESAMGSTENTFWNNLWSQAAAQGITAFVSTGDSGASGCDAGSDSTGSGLAVSGLASTPYNVAVGGTQLSEGAGSYWNSANGTGGTSAKSYIPEVAWNESGSATSCPSGDTCSGLWATSGGASAIYGKPAWQVCTGVPADGKRDIPDVSLAAAGGHDGYLVETQGALYAFGGTSASSPSFAGLMALIVQQTGQRQGNANPRFYQLGNAQFGASGTAVFHDIVSGNNTVPGVSGYASVNGYDRATGLGSVDANALVTNWSGAPSATPTSTAAASSTATFTATPTLSHTATFTPTSTMAPTSTNTSTPMPTNTRTNTPTTIPTATPSNTATPIPTGTPSNTSTPIPTGTNTSTPIPTGTPSNTSTPTVTATGSAIATPTPTDSPTSSPSPTSTVMPTASSTPTPTLTATATPTETATPTSTSLLVRGNGNNPSLDRSGCQLQWMVTTSQPALDRYGLPKVEQTCVDGDASCDFKPSEPGVCSFQVAVCLNESDPHLPACVPSGISSVTVRLPRPTTSRNAVLQTALTQDLGALQGALVHLLDPTNQEAGYVNAPPLTLPQENFCSAPFIVDVPVNVSSSRSNRRTVTLLTRSINGATTPRVALSRLKLTCKSLPAL